VRARPSLALLLAFVACAESDHGKKSPNVEGGSAGGSESAAPTTVAATSGDTTPSMRNVAKPPVPNPVPLPTAGSGNRTIASIDVNKEFPIVRGLYVNRFHAQSLKSMQKLIQIADETEINALVIDMKDEFGLNYKPANPEFARNAGTSGTIRNLPALLDTLRAHKILAIARLVVFKDSVTARVHPEWTIRKQDGGVWRDKKGLAWVNPYHHELWDYNIGVAEELVKMGFSEIQFDYIRFPEPYKSLPQQVFPDDKGTSKPDALSAFLKEATGRIDKLGARTTADIFGLVTTVGGPLEIGQWWEKLAPNVDVLLPMVYPSHYPPGSFNIRSPNADPYQVIRIAISKAKERDAKLGIKKVEHVRPYLQAFTLGSPHYGPEQLNAEKKATYDSGSDGWVLWNAGSRYDEFLPALEKELVSRKRPTP
jgi:hypothetical protein